jgi:hypothetical protein
MSATAKARFPRAVGTAHGGRRTIWLAAGVLGTLSLLAVGAVHLQWYFELYNL